MAAILVIEATLGVFGTAGRFNTDFFDFSPFEQDNLQKHTIYDKYVLVLGKTPSDAVQVGDSSGFCGVKPSEVAAASGGISYLNLSCCGDAGWTGYFEEAKLALQRDVPLPRFLVLHVTPYWPPAAPRFHGDNSLAVLIRDYLVQDMWWHRVRPPSAGYRLRALNAVQHGQWTDDFLYDEWTWPTIGYPGVQEWRKLLGEQRGWTPMPVDLKDPVVKAASPSACAVEDYFSESRFLGLDHRDTLYDYLRQFAELARAKGMRFVFVTNPVPCIVERDRVYEDVERQMTRFKADYPDVLVPFDFFRQAPAAQFADRYHLKDDGVGTHSRRIGAALGAVAAP